MRGGASGDRIHRLASQHAEMGPVAASASAYAQTCAASLLTGAGSAADHEVRFVQTPFWISSIWADDDFQRIENQFEEGPVMLEDKLGPAWSEFEMEKSKFPRISCSRAPTAGVVSPRWRFLNIEHTEGPSARMTRFHGPESSWDKRALPSNL